MEMSGCEFYVKNEKEELIGLVSLSRFEHLRKIVVDNYTRDNAVMNSHSVDVIRCNEENKTKFEGFAKYLRDRKKAAVGKITDRHTLFILPPRNGKYDELQCEIKETNAPQSTQKVPSKSNEGGGGLLSSLLAKACTHSYTFAINLIPSLANFR